MWVLRRPVCVDAACSMAIDVFSAHWFADAGATATRAQWQAVVPPGYDRQAAQTVSFLQRTAGSQPHILIGDLNTWEGSQRVCFQDPPNAGLDRLRAAGYVDAWPLLHGGAEGFTGMTNRAGCGMPEGYAWKRPDYVWSPAHYLPVSITRFGVVPAGDPAPSDHYGLIAEFPVPPPSPTIPLPPVAPPSIALPAGEIVLHARDAPVIAGNWRVVDDGQAAGGARLASADRGVPKVSAALAVPADYFELTFTADAGRPYRLWIRGRAEADAWTNDSVFVQFSGAVTSSGQPALAHRNDRGGGGESRRGRRQRARWMGLAGQRLRRGCARPDRVLRRERHADGPRADPRGRHLARSDPAVPGLVPDGRARRHPVRRDDLHALRPEARRDQHDLRRRDRPARLRGVDRRRPVAFGKRTAPPPAGPACAIRIWVLRRRTAPRRRRCPTSS